jgi:disulfide bond formation protein DsbB
VEISPKLAITLNALALYAISAVLAVAFYWQFAYGELPCPLCMLQRASFSALAVGPVLAIRHGPKPQHYGLTILAALMGAAVAARQILLHIMPGDPGFGSPSRDALLHVGVSRVRRRDPCQRRDADVRRAVGGDRAAA